MKSNIQGEYFFIRTVREKIYPDLVATVEESNTVCSHCHSGFSKGDKVVVYEEQESVQISHMSHLEVDNKP